MKFLWQMWLITKAVIMHPFSATDINLDTGEIKVVKEEEPDEPYVVISSAADRRQMEIERRFYKYVFDKSIEIAKNRVKQGKVCVEVEDVDNAAGEILLILNESDIP